MTSYEPCRVALDLGGDWNRCLTSVSELESEQSFVDVSSGPVDALISCQKGRLSLGDATGCLGDPICVDFVGGATGFRRQSGVSTQQTIARAVGVKRRAEPFVVDATGGLGRDAFLLACLGCRVTIVERSSILGALLRDGIRRALSYSDPELQRVLERMTLVVDDATNVLDEPGEPPEVVYIDPMFEPKDKSALAKREMRICRLVVGDDDDADQLFAKARTIARKRVVVKRHRHAAPLSEEPDQRYVGKSIRYDAYFQAR